MPPKKRKASTSKTSASSGKASQKSKKVSTVTPGLFPFLNLPREIRDMVYKHVVGKRPIIRLGWHLNPRYPDLSKASKQIRKEFFPIYFEKTTFCFHIHGLQYRGLLEWFSTIGPELTTRIKVLHMYIRIHLPGDGCITWSEPRKFVEACEQSLSRRTIVCLFGERRYLAPFHIACQMGRQMRNCGLSWGTIETLLFRAKQMVTSSFEMCLCDDMENYDMEYYEDSEDDDKGQKLYCWGRECTCMDCKAARALAKSVGQ